MANKILNRAELLEQVALARASGQRVVHCHGCFDIVHPGHVRYLEFAREQGDLLVVSLTGDSQINKGDQRPYIPQEMRAENLAALEAVDLVYINPFPTAVELLEELRPDVYVKGREYEQNQHPDFLREQAVVERHGGRVVFSSGDVVFSSTRLIESLASDPALEIDRLRAICCRHEINRPRMRQLLERFAGLRVLVIGDLIADHYVMCDATDLASESPMMSLTRLEERMYVGGAGIIARHLAGLGANTYLLSAIAPDDLSRQIRELLEQEAVTTHLIPSRSCLPSKTRFLVEHNKVLRVQDGKSQPLDSVAERDAMAWIGELTHQIDAIILADFGYGTITAGVLEQVENLVAHRPIVLTADVSGPRNRLLEFKNAHLLCPTERELRASVHDFERGLSNVVWNVMDSTRARHVFVTLGSKGVVVFDRQDQNPQSRAYRERLRSEYLPAFVEHAVDPLGCGDAMLATATLTLTAGGSLMQAAYLGSGAAACEAMQLGNMPINQTVLQSFLAHRPELLEPPVPQPHQVVPTKPVRTGPPRIAPVQ